jgi:Cytochrome c biogenesis factor
MEKIKKLISEGYTAEAISLLNEYISQHPNSDHAYLLRGDAYRKDSNFREALNNYLMAMELNPDSPARQSHNMLMSIMAFYNKDLYNP